jgi:predicted NBD/HSP70 family sugar kinase
MMIKILKELQQDRKEIFNLIQKKGQLSKQSIQLLTNLKLTTLNRIINDLLSKELIVEDSIGESTGGRKPTLYNVNSTKFYIIGIDISRTYTQVVVTNLRMQILKESRFLMEETYSSKQILEHIAEVTNCVLNELMINKDQILGIGVSAVGPLDREKGVLLNPINFEGENWSNISIKEELENIFNLPVTIDNGANSAVVAEYFYGSGKGLDNIVCINCGIGIRTGVITSGRIIRSINDREDAFGHMIIDIEGKSCYCGNYGCVESYASIPSIVKDFKEELKIRNVSLINKNIDKITYLDVFDAADKGDIAAKAVMTDSALVFGTALANYINLLNPQLIILSGPTVYKSEIFYKVAAETALKKINSRGANIKFSKGGCFKEFAMAIGAAAMVVEASLTSVIERR